MPAAPRPRPQRFCWRPGLGECECGPLGEKVHYSRGGDFVSATLRVMIALLRGVLVEKHPNQAIVEAGGVGYDVTIPVSTYTHLPEPGTEVKLRIHTHVREDAL